LTRCNERPALFPLFTKRGRYPILPSEEKRKITFDDKGGREEDLLYVKYEAKGGCLIGLSLLGALRFERKEDGSGRTLQKSLTKRKEKHRSRPS